MGCCRLEKFITDEGIERMQEETVTLSENARGNQKGRRTNAWYEDGDSTLPPSHPRNTFFHRNFGAIRDDMIAPDAAIRSVYDSESLIRFAADVLDVSTLYQSRDAYQALTINVMGEGEDLHWHFDNNYCAITLGIQQPESGGELEYIPAIGRANYDAIAEVMQQEKSTMSRQYQTTEGALCFFRGGQSMHRVRRVGGERLRLVAALQYHTSDDATDSASKTERIYGVPVSEHVGAKKVIAAAAGSQKF
eukprot:jgi/Bigna1/89111/estExt_fgenesh1_pg.C_440013